MKVSNLSGQGDQSYDLSKALEIGIPVQRTESVSSFQIKGARYRDYEDGGFIGNIERGGPCNLETIEFTAHGNGTHTECLGHVVKTTYYVNDCIQDRFYGALLISLPSRKIDQGHYLDFSHFNKADWNNNMSALVIRSLPNSHSKLHMDYSGSNAACIHPDDMQTLVNLGVQHLLLDLPSVDPEWDEGALASHHIFWQTNNEPRTTASITEFIYVQDQIKDGAYLLKLNIAPFVSDAAPSRPTLYPLI